jgi:hypothetical protein
MDTITAAAEFFEKLLAYGYFMAVVWGFAVSQALTQILKYPLRRHFYAKGQDPYSPVTPEIEVAHHRWWVRVIAFGSGFATTLAIWPDDALAVRIVVSVAVGGLSPLLYQVVTHWWPWLGEKATADRALPPPLPPPAPTRDDVR